MLHFSEMTSKPDTNFEALTTWEKHWWEDYLCYPSRVMFFTIWVMGVDYP